MWEYLRSVNLLVVLLLPLGRAMAGLPGICWDLPGLVTLASFLLTDKGFPLKGESAGIDLGGLMTELSSTFTRS